MTVSASEGGMAVDSRRPRSVDGAVRLALVSIFMVVGMTGCSATDGQDASGGNPSGATSAAPSGQADDGATDTPADTPIPRTQDATAPSPSEPDPYEGALPACQDAEDTMKRSTDLALAINGLGDMFSLLTDMSDDFRALGTASLSGTAGQGAAHFERMADRVADRLSEAAMAVMNLHGGVTSPQYTSGVIDQADDAWQALDRYCAEARSAAGTTTSASGQPPWTGVRLSQQWRDQVRDDVTQVQQRLTELGYGWLEPDGRYGPLTETAVRIFQGENGLAVDGVVGPDTWSALFFTPIAATSEASEGTGNDGSTDDDPDVIAPTPIPMPPQSAICNDGTPSYSEHDQGTCSWHGGVNHWS